MSKKPLFKFLCVGLVGAMYSKGKGIKEDDRKALKWLKESAHNGYRKAQLRLAYMLSKGGVRSQR